VPVGASDELLAPTLVNPPSYQTVTAQPRRDMSNETETPNEFDWDELEETATPVETPKAAPAPVQAPAAKKDDGPPLSTLFPEGSEVKFTATEFIRNYGVVQGLVQKGLVEYIEVKLTKYANGTERPADKQKVVATRPTSLELYTAPAE
jgi:hypothetical protein